ncbi:beta transducin [Fusarium mundagurra]|uniref:Beta transducin n=1 Tax=Fusarium mundagurra TaxID=1567541 RepID=A0A8H6D2G4_9HYPO|nr:beta transducin [Fusarium mundagurra]
MRLINTTTLLLESILEPRDVRYAILSHTWEQDEVSLQDFGNLDFARRKAGFSKIEKTCQIARSRGLKYAWVDTCCIDKTSSAELTEAINSMFEWYKQAQVCFAFISDLPPVVAGGPMLDWLAGGEYRWFSRGWTLQELIAPQTLEFFDSAWQPRGDRFTLRSGISQKSRIDISVLQNSACLPGIPVARKMSWASARKTTRVEDMAYCLLGIFNINMPLIYGEGAKAFLRLQEEICRESTDLSLFAWKAKSDPGASEQKFRGVLALEPSEFSHCQDVVAYHDYLDPNSEYSITNNGLRMEAKLGLVEGLGYILALNCVTRTGKGLSSFEWLGIFLRKTGTRFVRQYPDQLFATSDPRICNGQRSTVYIRKSLGSEESLQVADELDSRIYVRYTLANPLYTITDHISAPDALWNPQGGYFLTMESALPGAAGIRPPFTGFKGFDISYQGVHACSCLLVCGIFMNSQGVFRPVAVLYTDKDPNTKDVFNSIERSRNGQGGSLAEEIRYFVLLQHATPSGVWTWRSVCDRKTEILTTSNHNLVISLSINTINIPNNKVLSKKGSDAEIELGPDIRELPDEPAGSKSARQLETELTLVVARAHI